MKKKELKRLSRAELLELLLIQTKETERLQAELDEARRALEDRNLRLSKAGDLAQAVLEINGVMTAAQAAAEQYLENIARMEAETRERCESIIAAAEAKAQQKAVSPEANGSLVKEIYTLLGEIAQE